MPTDMEDDLNNVIADLIDSDDEEDQSAVSASPLPDIDSSGIDAAGPDLVLTERAAQQVRLIRENQALDDNLYLRVAVEGGGCSGLSYKLGFDHKTDEDETIVSHGIEVIVDSRHMMYLKGISVDYPDEIGSASRRERVWMCK